MKRATLFTALLSLVAAEPAMAESCWNQAATEAAQVKQLDIMMMVSTLRCHRNGIDLSADYNKFVISRRLLLRGVGQDLVKQFGQNLKGQAAVMAYDKLGVVMANSFGNGVNGRACEDIRGVIQDALTGKPDLVSLVYLARRNSINPLIPQPSCVTPIFATPVLTMEALGNPLVRPVPVGLQAVPVVILKGKKR